MGALSSKTSHATNVWAGAYGVFQKKLALRSLHAAIIVPLIFCRFLMRSHCFLNRTPEFAVGRHCTTLLSSKTIQSGGRLSRAPRMRRPTHFHLHLHCNPNSGVIVLPAFLLLLLHIVHMAHTEQEILHVYPSHSVTLSLTNILAEWIVNLPTRLIYSALTLTPIATHLLAHSATRSHTRRCTNLLAQLLAHVLTL